MAVRTKGLENVLANLNREVRRIKGAGIQGLLAGGLHIQGAAQRLTPVDTSNLKNSAYTRKTSNTTVEVGFSAEYALYVHEDLTVHHENGIAKFLEVAVLQEGTQVLFILRQTIER